MIPAWRHLPTALATPPASPHHRRRTLGFSLTEMIVVLAVLGIIAGIAIGTFGNLNESAKEAVARERVEMLNHAIHAFAQSRRQMAETPLTNQGDELQVLGYLQYRDAAKPYPGTPYVDQHYRPTASGSTADYRIQWTSNFVYKLLKPGDTGIGLKIPFDGTDMSTVPTMGINPSNRGF